MQKTLRLNQSAENSKYGNSLQSKKNKVPKHLYRYRDISNYNKLEKVIDEIKTGNVFLTHPKNFNDPFDCTTVLNSINGADYLNKSKQELRFILSNNFKKDKLDEIFSSHDWFKKFSNCLSEENPVITPEKMNTVLFSPLIDENKNLSDIIQNGIRIACFTEKNNNIPMWYHYSNDFSGICIEYDTNNTDKKFENLIFPVTYNENFKDVINEWSTVSQPNDISLYIQVASHKLIDWCYEKEWRLIVPVSLLGHTPNEPLKNQNGELSFFSNPTKVILGCKISPIAEKIISDICKEKTYIV